MNGNDLDIGPVLELLWKRRFWVGAVTLVCGVLGLGLALTADKVYRVESLLVAVSQESAAGALGSLGQLGGLASLVGFDASSGTSTVDEAIATMKSRSLTEQFISERNLLPILFADDWDEDAGAWTVKDPGHIPTLRDGYKLFEEDIRQVAQDEMTGLVTLSISWTDGATAVQWATDLVDRTNNVMRERTIHDLSKNIEYLERELGSTNVLAIREAITRIMESQIQQIAIANTRDQYSFRTIDPPVEPDPEDFVWPSHIMFVLIGLVFGFGICVLIAALTTSRRRTSSVDLPDKAAGIV